MSMLSPSRNVLRVVQLRIVTTELDFNSHQSPRPTHIAPVIAFIKLQESSILGNGPKTPLFFPADGNREWFSS
jgi:hypothetical protein